MLKKIKVYVKKYNMLQPGDTVVAGVSGGADSVCLLFVLLELRREIPFRLLAVHVNHGIREQAGADADFTAKLCAAQGIPFFLFCTDIRQEALEKRLSQEEAGRNYRYGVFEKVLAEQGGQGKIAVAHNQNDRAETMLFNLFRGSGLTGLCGIRPVRNRVIRPLLCVSRREIEDFLEKRHILYCTDHTNAEDTYTRNRIRHHILPYAEEEVCKGATAHLATAAEGLLEAEEYLFRVTAAAAVRCAVFQEDGVRINLSILRQEEELIQKRVFLYCLECMAAGRKDIGSSHIGSLMHCIAGAGSKEIYLPGELRAVKQYEILEIRRGPKAAADCPPVELKIPGEVWVPGPGLLTAKLFSDKKGERIPQKSYTKWFDYDKITSACFFRTRRTGDYLSISSTIGKKPLKEYMINEKIPRDSRDSFYVLADGGHIMWVPGYRISEHYKVSENTKTILQISLRGEHTDE